MEMDDGPQLAYYLVENPDKARLLAQLPKGAQQREIGRIQGLLEAKRATNQKPSVSQAPPPPSKVDGAVETQHVKVDTPDSDKLSDSEWARRRKIQLANRKRG
jgi:hypothetical protein